MKLFFHGGGCGDACCLRVQDLSVKIGSDCILTDVCKIADIYLLSQFRAPADSASPTPISLV